MGITTTSPAILAAPAGEALPPIQNMRIRFWGVQGSCPMFPEPHEITGFRWLVARDAIKRMILNLQQTGRDGMVPVEKLLASLDSDEAIEAYQKSLGESDLPVYGGETTCVVVETADNHVIVLDGGSGIRNASKHMIRKWGADRPRVIHILATHEHLDHRSGLPFCQFCFSRPPFDIRIHGSRQFLIALDVRYAIYSKHITPQTYYDDPIDYRVMSANFSGFEIPGPESIPPPQHWERHEPGASIRIGATVITPFDVYHGPTRCIAYKLEHGGKTFVFCTDHELRHSGDDNDPKRQRSLAAEARLREHCMDADLAYFDGQYFLAEYLGKRGIGVTAAVPRVDWGHGCIEDAVARSRDCRIRHTLIGHHDPERMWQQRMSLDQELLAEQAAGAAGRIELAKADMVVDL